MWGNWWGKISYLVASWVAESGRYDFGPRWFGVLPDLKWTCRVSAEAWQWNAPD